MLVDNQNTSGWHLDCYSNSRTVVSHWSASLHSIVDYFPTFLSKIIYGWMNTLLMSSVPQPAVTELLTVYSSTHLRDALRSLVLLPWSPSVVMCVFSCHTDPFSLSTYLPDVICTVYKCLASLEALLHFSEASFHHTLDTLLHGRSFINIMYKLVRAMKLTPHASGQCNKACPWLIRICT